MLGDDPDHVPLPADEEEDGEGGSDGPQGQGPSPAADGDGRGPGRRGGEDRRAGARAARERAIEALVTGAPGRHAGGAVCAQVSYTRAEVEAAVCLAVTRCHTTAALPHLSSLAQQVQELRLLVLQLAALTTRRLDELEGYYARSIASYRALAEGRRVVAETYRALHGGAA